MINWEVLLGKKSTGVGKRHREEREAKQVFDNKQSPTEGNVGSTLRGF